MKFSFYPQYQTNQDNLIKPNLKYKRTNETG